MSSDKLTDVVVKNDCINCEYFDEDSQKCTIERGSPIRSCVIGINRDFCKYVASNTEILEIGCGDWSFLKDSLPNDVSWYGIDVIDSEILTKVGGVGDTPYKSDRFDYVISNQSMEHWFEYGTPLQQGLSEISRVLKVGGEAWLNVPIHLQGHSIFIKGNEREIYNALDSEHWEIVKLEKWRKNHKPLRAYYPFGNSKKINYPPPDDTSTWIMNIVMQKEETQPTNTLTHLRYLLSSSLSKLVHKYNLPAYYILLNIFRIFDSKVQAIREIVRRMRLSSYNPGWWHNRSRTPMDLFVRKK